MDTAADCQNITKPIVLSCMMLNARSVKNKLAELHCLIYSNQYDCVFITETWLNSDYPNSMLDPENVYQIVRTDRETRVGGGVCALISRKHHISVAAVGLCTCKNSDVLSFDLHTDLSKYRFVVVYRPPGYDVTAHNDALALSKFIENRAIDHHGPVFVVGDINCPNIDYAFCLTAKNRLEQIISDAFNYNGFCQCVQSATRGDNILDIVCTTEPLLVSKINVCAPFSNSYHCQVEFDKSYRFNCHYGRSATSRKAIFMG